MIKVNTLAFCLFDAGCYLQHPRAWIDSIVLLILPSTLQQDEFLVYPAALMNRFLFKLNMHWQSKFGGRFTTCAARQKQYLPHRIRRKVSINVLCFCCQMLAQTLILSTGEQFRRFLFAGDNRRRLSATVSFAARKTTYNSGRQLLCHLQYNSSLMPDYVLTHPSQRIMMPRRICMIGRRKEQSLYDIVAHGGNQCYSSSSQCLFLCLPAE